MAIQVFKTEGEVLTAFADFFVATAQRAIQERGAFNVALSGGSSPKKVYDLLAGPDFSDQVDWQHVYFFFGDERYVPAGDPDNNALMAKKALFEPLQIADEQIFAVNTALSPEAAALDYTEAIAAHFHGRPQSFDLIMLGLGDNVHTASLFPYTSVLKDASVSVQAVFLPEQKVYRITMTAPLINLGRQIAFLVYGATKTDAVYHALGHKTDHEKYPAQLIQPVDGTLTWFLDKPAASRIVAL